MQKNFIVRPLRIKPGVDGLFSEPPPDYSATSALNPIVFCTQAIREWFLVKILMQAPSQTETADMYGSGVNRKDPSPFLDSRNSYADFFIEST